MFTEKTLDSNFVPQTHSSDMTLPPLQTRRIGTDEMNDGPFGAAASVSTIGHGPPPIRDTLIAYWERLHDPTPPQTLGNADVESRNNSDTGGAEDGRQQKVDDLALLPIHHSFDQHILLCVTFFGWASTRAQFKLHSYWDPIEDMYENFRWSHLSKLQGLSMMEFALAVSKTLCEEELSVLPAFGKPTYVLSASVFIESCSPPSSPKANTKPHRSLLEQANPQEQQVRYIPWPGLRNKIILGLDVVRTEEFTQDFCQSASFLFPSLNDAFFFDEASERFAFTPEWQKRRNDLTCYTCSSDFLRKYPQLQSVIPSTSVSARKVQPTGQGSGLGPPALYFDKRNQKRTTENGKEQPMMENTDDCSRSKRAKKRTMFPWPREHVSPH